MILAINGIGHYRGHLFYTNTSCFYIIMTETGKMGPNEIFVNFQISQFFKYIQREIRVGRKEAGQADAI